MSLEQIAYLTRALTPDRERLQAAIDGLGFDCKLDESYAPFRSSGFLPCVLNGKSAGFEVFFGSAVQELRFHKELVGTTGDRDIAISFRWGGSMAESACV